MTRKRCCGNSASSGTSTDWRTRSNTHSAPCLKEVSHGDADQTNASVEPHFALPGPPPNADGWLSVRVAPHLAKAAPNGPGAAPFNPCGQSVCGSGSVRRWPGALTNQMTKSTQLNSSKLYLRLQSCVPLAFRFFSNAIASRPRSSAIVAPEVIS